jgi:hypothetical protein
MKTDHGNLRCRAPDPAPHCRFCHRDAGYRSANNECRDSQTHLVTVPASGAMPNRTRGKWWIFADKRVCAD